MTERVEAKLLQRCTDLPVFPLPRAVLLPGSALPLHIFEPRYRRMLAHVLETDGLLAVGTIKPTVGTFIEPPDLFPWVGIGVVEAHDELEDGRSNIVLRSLAVAELQEELPELQGFRRFRATLCEAPSPQAAADLVHLRALVMQVGCVDEPTTVLAKQLVALSDAEITDALAPRVLGTTAERLEYLATTSGPERLQMLTDRLLAVVQQRMGSSGEA